MLKPGGAVLPSKNGAIGPELASELTPPTDHDVLFEHVTANTSHIEPKATTHQEIRGGILSDTTHRSPTRSRRGLRIVHRQSSVASGRRRQEPCPLGDEAAANTGIRPCRNHKRNRGRNYRDNTTKHRPDATA